MCVSERVCVCDRERFIMASGAGKAAQPPGPGSAVNGTAAEFANIEQELYDYQMHSKMCKKIAQLTKVRPAGDTEGHRERGGDREGRAAGRAVTGCARMTY